MTGRRASRERATIGSEAQVADRYGVPERARRPAAKRRSGAILRPKASPPRHSDEAAQAVGFLTAEGRASEALLERVVSKPAQFWNAPANLRFDARGGAKTSYPLFHGEWAFKAHK